MVHSNSSGRYEDIPDHFMERHGDLLEITDVNRRDLRKHYDRATTGMARGRGLGEDEIRDSYIAARRAGSQTGIGLYTLLSAVAREYGTDVIHGRKVKEQIATLMCDLSDELVEVRGMVGNCESFIQTKIDNDEIGPEQEEALNAEYWHNELKKMETLLGVRTRRK
ncbi:MAG: hypothetical protein ACXABY_24410 [Candidatus Thorarchaeota archaeon]|jgi:hypothetical protein